MTSNTGDGRGADRISGAGPAAWARVICSIAVHYRGSDPEGASMVLLGAGVIGGEIADTRFRIRRRVRADDPADLGSPLSYAVEVLAAEDPEDLDPAAAALSKSRQWVLAALRAGGLCRRSSSWGTAWPRPATRSSPGPSRPLSASWREPDWRPGAKGARAGPATGHPSPPTPTAETTPAMVGERERHNLPQSAPLARRDRTISAGLWEGVTLSDENARSRFRECHTHPGRLRAARAVQGPVCWSWRRLPSSRWTLHAILFSPTWPLPVGWRFLLGIT
jgi:hypothetical protein